MPKLTTDLLKTALPLPPNKRLELRDNGQKGAVSGLIFRVTSAGERSWSVRYRNGAGAQRRQTLGRFPEVGLAEARRRAEVAKGQVSGGVDPVQEQRDADLIAKTQRLRTFKGLAEAYFEDAKVGLHRADADAKRTSTTTEERRIYDRHIEPHFGSWAIADMTRAEIQDFVNKQTRQAKSRGRYCRNIIRQILAYAEWKQLLPFNPALKIAVSKSVARTHTIADADLRAFWAACRRPQDVKDLDLSPEMGMALRMALVTLQRGIEVVGMRWAEIDRQAKTWLIPADRMKGKREHVVPLSDLALAILDEAEGVVGGEEYVFQTSRPGSVEAKAMERTSFSHAMARVVAKAKIQKATPHDFRRTGSTNLTSERIGIPRFIVSKIIAHASDTGGAAAVTGKHYDMHDYMPEKRKALEAWAALLEEIVEGRQRPANVVPIAAAR
jgi:integrase